MDIKRGDIFYIQKFWEGGYGSEQDSGRPAVIVSNDTGNYHSNICEVVYLTTQVKKPLPTHVKVLCKLPSIALCEQINCVSQERIGEYIRTCTEEEMKKIDWALMVSLGVDPGDNGGNNQKYDDLLMKLEGAERALDDADMRFEQMKADRDYLQKQLNEVCVLEPVKESGADVIKLEIERDFYKQQYETLFERMIAR